MTTPLMIGTIVVSVSVSLLISYFRTKISLLEMRNEKLEHKLTNLSLFVDHLDRKIYELEKKGNVKPKKKSDEK